MFLRVCVCVVCFGSGVFRRNACLSHARLSDDLHPRHDQMLTRFTSGFAFIFLYDCTARTSPPASLARRSRVGGRPAGWAGTGTVGVGSRGPFVRIHMYFFCSVAIYSVHPRAVHPETSWACLTVTKRCRISVPVAFLGSDVVI